MPRPAARELPAVGEPSVCTLELLRPYFRSAFLWECRRADRVSMLTRRIFRLCALASMGMTLATPAVAQTRRALLLYDERTDLPGLATLDAHMVQTLTDQLKGGVEIYREQLDLSRFRSAAHSIVFSDYLRAKYAGKKIDVIIAAMGPSLDFMLDEGRTVFPGTPVVFCGIDRRELGARRLTPNVTGVLLQREFEPTLETALRLHPGTEHVFFVAGSSQFDRRLAEAAEQEFTAANRARIELLDDLPLGRLLDTLSRLPSHSVVLYSTMFRDGAGNALVPHEAAERIAAASNAPVYAFVDQYLGRGIVGGHLYSLDSHGEEAARLALRILSGTPPSEIPVIERASNVDAFDWRQLKRWGIDESRLPVGSVVRFRETSSWERHKRTIIIVAVVLLLQTALIVTLLVERRSRRRTQAALRESEARGQIAGVSLGVGFWTWETAGDRVWLSDQCARLLGLDRTGSTLEDFLAAVRPRTRGTIDDAFERAVRSGEPFDGEWPLPGSHGEAQWIAGAIRTSEDPLGARRVIGALIDVTERKSAERLAAVQRRELSHLGRVAVVGELSAALAHELNQPLAAILANARAAQRLLQRDGASAVELGAILEDIVADGRRAGLVIGRVRGLVKKDESEAQPLSLNDVVEEVIDLAHSDLIDRGVVVKTRVSPDIPVVSADRVQLQQVLLNLVMNACDAMTATPSGERTLTISTSDSDGAATVAVADRGSGIVPEALETVFEPFVTTKRNGLGLGLAICRSIIDAHGGAMWAVNNADRGATFMVSLPLASGAVTAAELSPLSAAQLFARPNASAHTRNN